MTIQDKITTLGVRPLSSGETLGASLTAIDKLQRDLEISLPSDYRLFLRDFGMLAFDDDVAFDMVDASGYESEGSIELFYGIAQESANDADKDFDLRNHFRSHDYMADYFLPIGSDSCGNQICLSLATDQHGSVMFWYHDADEVFKVSDTFEAFVRSLRRLETNECDIASSPPDIVVSYSQPTSRKKPWWKVW